MTFKQIYSVDDIKPFVANKPEIKWQLQSNGALVGCYMFMDSHTFDTPEALECRGIAFDDNGLILSRPLHKFFNVGEKQPKEEIAKRTDVACIYEKLDGSIISTSRAPAIGGWCFRSRKSYNSDVVKIANDFVVNAPLGSDYWGIRHFCQLVTEQGFTASFELTSPDAQIVLPQQSTLLRLLHVRDNCTGEYVMLNYKHPVWDWIETFDVPLCPVLAWTVAEAYEKIEKDETREGVVIQFTDGDMVKLKSPWYLRLHKSISFMRERDIADLALRGELDDVRSALKEVGIDTFEVDAIERSVKEKILDIDSEVNVVLKNDLSLDRKSFAIKYKDTRYFGLLMSAYLGKEVDYAGFYRKHRLDEDFTMRTLIPSAAEEVA